MTRRLSLELGQTYALEHLVRDGLTEIIDSDEPIYSVFTDSQDTKYVFAQSSVGEKYRLCFYLTAGDSD